MLLFLFCVLLMNTLENPGECFVLAPGTFHGNEVLAETGEIWLGLFVSEEGCELLPVELQVTLTEDYVLDRDGEKTAKKVFNQGTLPLIYLSSSDDDVFSNAEVFPILLQGDDLDRGDVLNLSVSETLEVRVEGLYYAVDRREQRICDSYENLYGEGVSIVWAGDIDGDGITDLIINDRGHYAIPLGLKVFLSSYATDDELVHLVAEFVTVSC